MTQEDDPIYRLARAGVEEPEAWEAIADSERQRKEAEKERELAKLELERDHQPSALRTILENVDLAQLAESLIMIGVKLGSGNRVTSRQVEQEPSSTEPQTTKAQELVEEMDANAE